MTDEALDRCIRDIYNFFKESDRRQNRNFAETARCLKRTAREIELLARQVNNLTRQLGGFTEGIAFPSIRKILMEHLHLDHISQRVLIRQNERYMQVDLLAFSRSNAKVVYVVEIKNRLTNSDIEDTVKKLAQFYHFFPEHQDKILYGIIAAMDVTEEMKEKVIAAGIYLAYLREESFRLEIPDGFQPKPFGPPGV